MSDPLLSDIDLKKWLGSETTLKPNLNLWNFQKTSVLHSIDKMQSNLQSFVHDLLNLFHQMNLPFLVYYVISRKILEKNVQR